MPKGELGHAESIGRSPARGRGKRTLPSSTELAEFSQPDKERARALSLEHALGAWRWSVSPPPLAYLRAEATT